MSNLHVVCLFLVLSQLSSAEEYDDVPLIPKCCPWGQSLTKTGGCKATDLPFEPQFRDEPPIEVDLLIGETCQYGRYRLEPDLDSQDEFHILSNGSLLVPFIDPGLLGPYEYCLDTVEGPQVVPYLCFDPPTPTNKWKDVLMTIYPIGCLISVPFLLATFVIFTWVEKLRDLHGKVLACHSICLAAAYTFLAIVQLTGKNLSHGLCISIAFIIQFSFLACFFWLNVLCYHTWWKMALSENHAVVTKSVERRRFVYYNIYAWTLPLLLLVASVLMDLTPSIPSTYLKPNFGVESCWFQSDRAALPYFYGPVALLLVVNLIFFFLTACSIHRSAKIELDSMADNMMANISWQVILGRRKTVFVKCLLLFCIMGLNWVAEVISWWIGGPPQAWIVTDVFNTLQGVVVFVVFVVRDSRVRHLLVNKISSKSSAPTHTAGVVSSNSGHYTSIKWPRL